MTIKRYLYLWHRWLGIVLCLFMAAWFFSGMVMLYVGYPKLTPEEHLAHLPELPQHHCCISMGAALAASERNAAPLAVRLSSVAGSPRYLLDYAEGTNLAVDARSGRLVTGVDTDAALASARQYADDAGVIYRGLVHADSWTQTSALDKERPLHRVQLEDEAATLLYISSQTGAVVRDATHVERVWNWLGAWLHWIYPIRDHPWWAQIVIYLSLAATVMALLGQMIGLLRWRFSTPYRLGSRSPYPGGFARWHHIGGLLFGTLLIAWVFSGLISMNPWALFSNASQLSTEHYRAGLLGPESDPEPVADTLSRFRQAGFSVHELHWQVVGGTVYRVAYDSMGESRVLARGSAAQVLMQIPVQSLQAAVSAMGPDHAVEFQLLESYDAYHYPRAEQSMYGNQRKRLPLLRARFDDAVSSWVHVDPYSGALLQQLDQRRRASRWLFNLLHSWDWLPLLERPLLREGLIIGGSLGGLIISLSGVVLGWRRLRKKRRPRKAAR